VKKFSAQFKPTWKVPVASLQAFFYALNNIFRRGVRQCWKRWFFIFERFLYF